MRKLFTIASLVAVALVSCTNEEPKSEEKGEGRVSITCSVATDVVETRANVSCTTPAVDDFALKIEGVGHDYVAEYASLAEFAEDNYLASGTYKATVTAGDVVVEGYDKATFIGSEEFTIEARAEIGVDITATIANALVKVEVTDNFKTYFSRGYSLTLTTEAGNEYDVTAQTEPLFIAPTTFTVTGSATKQPAQSGKEGVTVDLGEYKSQQLSAQTLYSVKMDVADAGEATLTITLNDTLVDSIVIDQELNDNAEEK